MKNNKNNKKKIRAEFRKKHETRTRKRDLTRNFSQEGIEEDSLLRSERLSGKGELTRKRTVVGELSEEAQTGVSVRRDVSSNHLEGRVTSIHGLTCVVRTEDGRRFRCTVRRLLKTLSTDQRSVLAVGDRVLFLPESAEDGRIERVEPRHGVISRTSKGRQHVIVVNVDQLLIVTSAAEPTLKPNLIDRFLVTAERSRIQPIICVNKIDLVNAADLEPLVGTYGQMGYEVLLVSAQEAFGIEQLRKRLRNRQTAVAGQSGVGKSSLLNEVQPGLNLRVGEVSTENQKGKHTTTTAQLLPLEIGGYVVDTPGIRQFQLWDVVPEEIATYYRDVRPFVNLCRFPNCTHTHEADCAVKDAVADGLLDARRYESYCHLFAGEEP